nr:replicase polyprotein [Elm carlavirus]
MYNAGIYFSPFSAMAHSHPTCKTLENYFLYKVLPSYIDNTFFLVGIKKHKVEFLKKRDRRLNTVEVINRYVTSADKLRYGSDFTSLSMSVPTCSGRKTGGFASPALKDLVPNVLKHKARALFIHDEIHYWDKGDLLSFLESVRPGCLLATLVFPPEVLAGSKVSLNKWCYDFDIIGKDLYFYPDGVRTEGYIQPISGGNLLRTKRIVLDDGTVYCVDLVHSKFCHHLVSITMGDALTEKARCFSNFEAVSSKHLGRLCKNVTSTFPIAHTTISKIYRYLRTLLKPDVQSAMAKLGQLVPEPTGFEIKFVQEFAKFVISAKNSDKFLCPDFFKDIKVKGLMLLPNIFSRLFPSVKGACLDDFVADLREFAFQVDLVDMHRSFDIETTFLDFIEAIPEGIDPEAVDAEFTGENKFARAKIMTYGSDVIQEGICSPKYVLEVNETTFRRLIAQFAINSFVSSMGVRLNSDELSEVLLAIVDKHPLGFAFQHLCIGDEFRRLWSKIKNFERRVKKVLFDVEEPGLWFGSTHMRRHNCKYLGFYDRAGEQGKALSKCLSLVCEWKDVKLRRCLDFQYTKGYMGYKGVGDECPVPFWLTTETGHEEEVTNAKPARHEPEFKCPTAPPVDVVAKEMKEPQEVRTLCCTCGISMDIHKADCKMIPPFNHGEILKNRKGCWYSEDSANYSYTGGKHSSRGWPMWISEFLSNNGHESVGYNCVLDQLYDEGGSIPFHADDEACFVAGSPVLTVNVIGTAIFMIRRDGCYGAQYLESGDCFTMPPGFQEDHKHSVADCTKGRRSLTFRVLKNAGQTAGLGPKDDEQYGAANVDYSEEAFKGTGNFNKVDVPADGDCFWHAVGYYMGLNGKELKTIARKRLSSTGVMDPNLKEQMREGVYAERESVMAFCDLFNFSVSIHCANLGIVANFVKPESNFAIDLLLLGDHYMVLVPKNDCVVKAIASSLGREVGDVLKVLHRAGNKYLMEELKEGEGLSSSLLEDLFTLFDVRAEVIWDNELVMFNEGGRLTKHFTIKEDHMEHVKALKETSMQVTIKSDVESFTASSMAILRRAGTELNYRVEASRVEKLAQSLLNGDTGSISSNLIDGARNLMQGARLEDFDRGITAILGTFGAGKSTLFKEFFKKCLGKHVTFVSPRKGLAEDFKRDVLGAKGSGKKAKGGMHWGVYTFEVFLKKMGRLKEGQVLILDEIQLYPPCYLDLVLASIKKSVKVYVVGDPCQSDYHSDKDQSNFDGVETDVTKMLTGQEFFYNIKSKRFCNAMFQGRLPCTIDPSRLSYNEPYIITDSFDDLESLEQAKRNVFLVPGFEEKKIVRAHYGDKVTCMTFGESTGRTFKFGVILVTTSSRLVSERRWVTALSRFSDNLVLLNLLGIPNEQINFLFGGRVLDKFLTGGALITDLYEMLPGRPIFRMGFDSKIGKDQGVREEKMIGDPWLKGMIELNQKEDMEMIEVQEELAQENWFKTHLPRCDMESIRASWVHKICAKEHREMWIKSLRTEQFTDEHSKNRGAILTNAAERFETIYPRHRNGDTATFLMAVRKRMRFSKPAVEKGKLIEAECYGEFLLKKFLSLVPLKPKHDVSMMDAAREDFFDKKTSKSSATIANHAGRSCRDWLIDVAFIFSKSQLCTKYEKRFVNAKAAQSIVCFQHSVLCRFAPYMRYIEKKLNEALPKKFYVHSGKGLEELNEWVLNNDFTGVCTESDYEAFDASQDQYIMAFELAVMRYLGLPRDLIEDYKYIKTHLGSKLGNFAIMRFSGEASTFLFNTMANMLFTFLRYELTGKEAICFAGDDMCASKKLRTTNEHEGFLNKLKLKAKVAFTKTPTFCGWNLTKVGIFKKPQLVFERMCIAKELNNLANCIDNYAIEVAYAYRLGEAATCLMSEEELENHYQCVRTVVQNKHLIKSDVLKIFEA